MARNYLHIMLDTLDNEDNLVKTPKVKRNRKKSKDGKRFTLNRKAARNAKEQLQTVS
ncbi:MAG: hypothetical protein ACPG5O_12740 [Pseudoalteromonas tetraodonis]